MLIMGIFDLFKRPKVPFDVIIAADLGDRKAKAQLSRAFDKGLTSEEHNQLRWDAYLPLAGKGDANAQYWIGFLCSMIKKDAKAAIYWWELSANQGNVDAMNDLAHGYSEFVNEENLSYGPVPLGRDQGQEFYWRKKAAETGDKESIEKFNLYFPEYKTY